MRPLVNGHRNPRRSVDIMTLTLTETWPSGAQVDPPGRPVLEVNALRKSFDGRRNILEGIDLEIPSGEFCVLLGPSGSGKSTLLRTIIGLCPLSEGQVVVGGTRLTGRNMRAVQRRVGMVHQSFGLIERLSALQNVLAGTAAGASMFSVLTRHYPVADCQRGLMLLEQVGIDGEMAHQAVRTLSGGQRQRVGIARALIRQPQLILADEPVASLDPVTAREVLSLLRQLPGQAETSVLCSLHQVNLAREFADRIIALKNGRIVFNGPPGQLQLDQYNRIYERS